MGRGLIQINTCVLVIFLDSTTFFFGVYIVNKSMVLHIMLQIAVFSHLWFMGQTVDELKMQVVLYYFLNMVVCVLIFLQSFLFTSKM